MEDTSLEKVRGSFPGCLVLFFDRNTNIPPGPKTGYNQTGIFVSEDRILFCCKRKIKEVNFNELKGSKVTIAGLTDRTLYPKIIEYFQNSKSNYRLFKLGIRALARNNHKVFSEPHIMPKFHYFVSDEEYETAWNRVISKLQKTDVIFTLDSRSLISKIIALLDKGSWSHCGIYAGNGEIFECISRGTIKRTLEVYKDKHVHLGVYRAATLGHCTDKILDEFIRIKLGSGYGYLKALILGIRTLLGFTEDEFSPRDVTPNGIIYSGDLYLVDYL